MINSTSKATGRIGISIGGVQIASFPELKAITTKGDRLPKGNKLLAHELTHVVQQHVGKKNIIIRLNGSDLDRASLNKLRSSAGREIKLTVYNKSGAPTLAIKGNVGQIETDATQQEWALTYESLQRVL